MATFWEKIMESSSLPEQLGTTFAEHVNSISTGFSSPFPVEGLTADFIDLSFSVNLDTTADITSAAFVIESLSADVTNLNLNISG